MVSVVHASLVAATILSGTRVNLQVSKSTVYCRCHPCALLCWRLTPDTFVR